jgi:hypothetical protein
MVASNSSRRFAAAASLAALTGPKPRICNGSSARAMAASHGLGRQALKHLGHVGLVLADQARSMRRSAL